MKIDLCKLRTGDVVFSLYPAASSFGIAAGTGSLISHAAIVLYPDIWFETNGLGSGFKIIDKVSCFQMASGKRSAVADLEYIRLSVLRLKHPVQDTALLNSISQNIILSYAKPIEFLPLFVPFKFFPETSENLVRKIIGNNVTGGYCSQMVYRILKQACNFSSHAKSEHISPAALRRKMLRLGARKVSVRPTFKLSTALPDPTLDHKYEQFLKISSKLASFNYPYNRASFERALSVTFRQMGLPLAPANYAANINALKSMMTRPHYYSLHRRFWPIWYT